MDENKTSTCQACSCPCEAHKIHVCDMQKDMNAKPVATQAGKDCPTCHGDTSHEQKEGSTCGTC